MYDAAEATKGEVSKTRSAIRQLYWRLIELAPEYAYAVVLEDVHMMFSVATAQGEMKKVG